MITYQKGSLFDAPKTSMLVHSCNCKGKWNTGIAVQFKERFPRAFQEYEEICRFTEVDKLIGKALILFDSGYFIGCLFTSTGESHEHDSEADILVNTASALNDLIIKDWTGAPIHMPKINSGRFNVPWEKTEKILSDHHINYKVWVQEGEL